MLYNYSSYTKPISSCKFLALPSSHIRVALVEILTDILLNITMGMPDSVKHQNKKKVSS